MLKNLKAGEKIPFIPHIKKNMPKDFNVIRPKIIKYSPTMTP